MPNQYNPYTEEERLQINRSRGILVDQEDEWLLREHTWSVGRYATTSIRFDDGTKRTVFLHHCILGWPIYREDEIGHNDDNGLNNRRSNIAFTTRRANLMNRKLKKHNIFFTRENSATTQLGMYIGTFTTDEELEAEKHLILDALRKSGYEFPHERRRKQT